MYEAYWQLREKPFEEGTETRFYYPGSDFQAALLKLRYTIESRRSAGLLCGLAGAGKTMLLQCLAEQLSETCHPIVPLVFPQLEPPQLLAYIADRLCGEQSPAGEDNDTRWALQRIESTLEENSRQGRQAVLLLDEAHILADTQGLETLRLLTNLQYGHKPCLTVILCGLPRLLYAVGRSAELEQRFSVRCLMSRLSEEETECYVQHRLAVAGAEREIFDRSAVRALHELGLGLPRRINRLADLALLVGFGEELDIIGSRQIEVLADELGQRQIEVPT